MVSNIAITERKSKTVSQANQIYGTGTRGIFRYSYPDIDFTDETVVQCNIPVVKVLLQTMVINK